jgi:hypothetical protein
MEEQEMKEMGGGRTHRCGHDHEHPDMMGMLMCLAKDAHVELLKEKIKKKIDATQGKKMDEIAQVIADAMAEKMKMKMGKMRKKREMREEIEEILMEE